MATGKTTDRPHIVLCECVHYDIIPADVRRRVLAALSQAGLEVEVVPDLCGLAAQRDPRLQRWAQAPSLWVVACYPRAVRWLFHAGGAPSLNGQVHLFNMRVQTPEEIVAAIAGCGLRIADPVPAANPQSAIINPQSSWVPWFPVIDYDRCRNCQQCLNFCLFGVYALSEAGRVAVRKPAGCKTNCPACARMCPQKAIIFPKYGEPPINGAEVPASTQVDAGPKPVAGDVYDRIRQRAGARQRFSVGAGPRARPDQAGQPQAIAPGGLCPTLEGLRQELGIPPEVLKSLSPAELARVAGESRRKVMEKPQGDGAGQEKERHE